MQELTLEMAMTSLLISIGITAVFFYLVIRGYEYLGSLYSR